MSTTQRISSSHGRTPARSQPPLRSRARFTAAARGPHVPAAVAEAAVALLEVVAHALLAAALRHAAPAAGARRESAFSWLETLKMTANSKVVLLLLLFFFFFLLLLLLLLVFVTFIAPPAAGAAAAMSDDDFMYVALCRARARPRGAAPCAVGRLTC